MAGAEEADNEPTGMYPIVRFGNGVERLITPAEWTVEQGYKVVARRVQIPLKLAWAISIVRRCRRRCQLTHTATTVIATHQHRTRLLS